MLAKYLSCCHSKHTSSSSEKHYPTIIEELCHVFSLDELRKSTNNFNENQVIGETLFNIVYICSVKHNGAADYPVALKRMKSKSYHWKFKKEIEFLCQLHHPNLVSLIGFCDHKDEKILVHEYMSNRSLYDHLRGRVLEQPLSWKKRLEICIGAAKGLHFLHTGARRSIFHCDIKPQNILLDNNMLPKLSHLGFSLQGPHLKSKPKPKKVGKIIGAPDYLAPECIQTNTFTDKCDVYSFGMVLLEVACTNRQHTVFDKLNVHFMSDNFLENFLADEIIDPILMRQIAPASLALYLDVTKRCLKMEPNDRPIMGEVEVELEQALALQEDVND